MSYNLLHSGLVHKQFPFVKQIIYQLYPIIPYFHPNINYSNQFLLSYTNYILLSSFYYFYVQLSPLHPTKGNNTVNEYIVDIILYMDKTITQITNIRSLQQLRTHLQDHPSINLAIMVDRNNTTLLHFAAFNNDLPRMKLFIAHYKQFTQLNHGTGLYQGQTTFAAKLRAWVNSPNKEGYLPIHYAALHSSLEMMGFLEELGSNMQYRTTKNQNLLFMCAEKNSLKPLIYLMQSSHHYDVNEVNNKKQTILHLAVSNGYATMVSYLITIGAHLDAQDGEGRTPVMVAVEESRKEILKVLLIKGADRTVRDNNNSRPIDVAKESGRSQMVKVLFNEYTTWDKIKIKCNKKITYEPEKPSFAYSLLFVLFFHLIFLPVNLLSEFNFHKKYIKDIPLLFQGMYEIIILGLYFLLLRHPRKRAPLDLLALPLPFCAECCRPRNKKTYHCYICSQCIYRYDHHCPWINNCVGAHNVGKFTLFLLMLVLGLLEVLACNVGLLFFDKSYVQYRQMFEIGDTVDALINVLTLIFALLLLLGLTKLLMDQLKNLCSNSTSYERLNRHQEEKKKEMLVSGSDNDLLTNNSAIEEEDEEDPACMCFRNCSTMLSS